MDENEKRKRFLKQFAVQVSGIERKLEEERKKFDEETERMKPTIGEIADGYRGFISDLGEGFLEIVENYNMCLEIAKQHEIIGDVKLKARIKDFSSSRINSDKKILDDVFGMEIVAPTEIEKEILMLFSHLEFSISKDKKYNKPSGYVAYHCMGDFSPKGEDIDIEEWIKNTVFSRETKEYKRSKEITNYSSRKNMVPIFPKLKQFIKDPESLTELAKAFEEMKEYMDTTNTELQLPIIETQFKTVEVEENALRGTASHSKYKPVDEGMIENKFRNGQLIRGINSPWKFEGTKNGLKLQNFYETLIQNWPFLKKTIVERRNAGKEGKDRRISAKFDYLIAAQFPFLRKYIPQAKYDDSKRDEIWGALKIAMIVNRLDETEPLEDELLAQIENIWGGASRVEDENGGHSL